MCFEAGSHALAGTFADVDKAGVVDEDVKVAVFGGCVFGGADDGLVVGHV